MNSIATKFRIPALVWLLGVSCFLLLRHFALTQPGSTPLPWDTGWYAKIVDNGYSFDCTLFGQNNVVFMPLYPLSVRLVKIITGIKSTSTSMLITSSVYCFFSLFYFYKIIHTFFHTSIALASVLLYAFFPYSFFLFSGYAEGCFVFFSMAFFHAFLVQRRYYVAAFWGSLSVLAKQFGVVLIGFYVFGLLWEALVERGRNPPLKQKPLRTLGCTFPILFLGLAAHTVFLYFRFKDPLLFVNALAGWTFTGTPIPQNLGDIVGLPIQSFRIAIHAIQYADGPLSLAYKLAFFATIVVLLSLWQRRSFFVLLYSVGFWMFNIFLRPSTIILDLGRYLLLFFPAFFCLPDLLYSLTRSNRLIYWICIFIIICWFLYHYTHHMTMFYQHQWIS